MRVVTWNTEWRKTASADASIIRTRLAALAPDIVCLTETQIDFLDEWDGFTVCGTDDWGGPTHGTRREVLLWSKHPWRNIDTTGSPNLPPGRFARATTDTSAGEIEAIGVVIPYHMSNVTTGTRNRSLWELHKLYLDALPAITSSLPRASIVLGDFNQRIPSTWVPRDLRHRLCKAMSGMEIATTGVIQPIGKAAIDHVAIGSGFFANHVQSISNLNGARSISDHFGVCVDLRVSFPNLGQKKKL